MAFQELNVLFVRRRPWRDMDRYRYILNFTHEPPPNLCREPLTAQFRAQLFTHLAPNIMIIVIVVHLTAVH